jgi:RAD50-interacting protein 1
MTNLGANRNHPIVGPMQLDVTAELDEPLHIIRRDLDFLSRALGTAAMRRTWRPALEKLSDMLWSDVLMKQHFTAYGAAQLMRDVQALCSLIDTRISDGSAALQTLADGVALLNLPVEIDEDEDEDMGENDDADARRGRMTLKQAADRVYRGNAEAKAVLEELGAETLSPANARAILRMRVEVE